MKHLLSLLLVILQNASKISHPLPGNDSEHANTVSASPRVGNSDGAEFFRHSSARDDSSRRGRYREQP